MARPVVQTKESAGADLYASECVTIPAGGSAVVGTQYFYDLPCAADIRSRSGLAFKYDVEAFNGLIDADYGGNELKVKLRNYGEYEFVVSAGDRIAQLVPHVGKAADYFDCLDQERTSGFGSTGK